jgi:threonine dehydrogenase-like Zn-dependent dehydrogenase
MKAITVKPKTHGTARPEDVSEPETREGSVLVEAIAVGVCGISEYAVADTAAKVVLGNNVLVGSVNANKRHWYKASQLLARADRKWLGGLITRREKPEDFRQALDRKPDDIKVVIQFSEV